jgi:hypothetical protein
MAFEWTTALEDQLFNQWWPTSNIYQSFERNISQAANPNVARRNLQNQINNAKASARAGNVTASGGVEWANYLNSYLQTQVQQAQQQAEVERAAQQAVMAKAEQDYAAAAKQAEESQIQAKRISAVADYQGQQLVEQSRQASALAMQSQVQPVQQRKKTQIGQPGVSRTRVSSGIGIGGYGGTSAGNVNPTGLNI